MPMVRRRCLLDEVDTLFGKNAHMYEDPRELINAGHRRGAQVGQCEVIDIQTRSIVIQIADASWRAITPRLRLETRACVRGT